MGAVAFLIAVFEVIPLLRDSGLVNHSHWEPAWKWDSFGAPQVLKWAFAGELLDFGRFPVLSVLALGGLIVIIFRHRRQSGPIALLAGGVLLLLLFFGRPAWGPLLVILGIPADFQLHRVIGGAHI